MSSLQAAKTRRVSQPVLELDHARKTGGVDSPRVPEKTSKDDEDVGHVVLLEDGVRDLLGRRHGLSDGGDVGCR